MSGGGDAVVRDFGTRGVLAGVAVPAQVGPYFVTRDGDPVELVEYAGSVGREVARAECARWARLGGDNGYELCADEDGTVWSVLLDWDEPDRFVNASPQAFAEGLAELRAALGVIMGADRPQAAMDAFNRLTERLRERDPLAFAEREHWWPLVLDDIRDTASVRNYAAFEYEDPAEGKRIVTAAGAVAAHPEERLWAALRAAGVEPEQVLRVHTDLEPCFLPGHYCSMWLAEVFPHAELTHSYPYGDTAVSRAEGVRLLREAAARDDGSAGGPA
ncbi:nucleic acid/nucleotide deaminase domain-containing protein [Actinacidiphila acididurans]|uniref:SUKH-4 family immunity protein n=1 Tax=Actinacidiphila acididurans TaxID=2784346 RepID=A0ABS2U3R0_9ACTN|nr:nucleic acid/nucleotide deaminase domain-containing protein [Actinacidiphila acididurans]MBM9510231.1 SUKH-4 family immunity protein [Actinacidiphila acididurans]